jgi:hypothetical protein
MNYEYITDFHKERENKIGSSEILCCVPHPVRAIESLAAWTDEKKVRPAETAIDLYNRKKNKIITEAGFPAEMGHWLEGKAISEFIKDNIDKKIASEFLRGYMLHKIEQDTAGKPVSPEPFNNTAFRHNTKASTDYAIVHADCIYDPAFSKNKNKIKLNKIEIDLSKPFIIEAKSANLFAVERRKKDQYRGYDLSLTEWQGIDLGHYFQIQYQMLIYGIDIAYLALIYNTNSKHYWIIKKNEKYQNDLKQLALYMKKCLDENTPPKQLAMNSHDIQSLFPVISEDFREAKGTELSDIITTVIKYYEAKEQSKIWSQRENEYQEQMSIHLKDTQIIKGNIGGIITDIARWKETGGGERIAGLKTIKEREDGATIEKYLRKKGLIQKDKENRKPSIVIKKKDIEGVEI